MKGLVRTGASTSTARSIVASAGHAAGESGTLTLEASHLTTGRGTAPGRKVASRSVRDGLRSVDQAARRSSASSVRTSVVAPSPCP